MYLRRNRDNIFVRIAFCSVDLGNDALLIVPNALPILSFKNFELLNLFFLLLIECIPRQLSSI